MNHSITRIVFLALVRAWPMNDTAHLADDYRGKVDIIFTEKQLTYLFNLDRFKPEGDSCVELIINFRTTPGAWACFQYNNERRWQFEKIGYYDSSERQGSIKVKTISDEEGYFLMGRILIGTDIDSLPKIKETINRKWDVPVLKNPSLPFDFSFERKVSLCAPRVQSKVIVRKFTYPPWYMRREPVYNYPELSMFHYGSSVHMPTPGSVNERGFLMNYWHILHPPELEYEKKEKK
jgi:hypothetical protein